MKEKRYTHTLRLSLFSCLCLRCVLSVLWMSEAQETLLQNVTHSYSAQYTLAWLSMFIHVSFSVGVSNLKRNFLLFGVACKVKPSMSTNFDCCRPRQGEGPWPKTRQDKTRQDDFKANQGQDKISRGKAIQTRQSQDTTVTR